MTNTSERFETAEELVEGIAMAIVKERHVSRTTITLRESVRDHLQRAVHDGSLLEVLEDILTEKIDQLIWDVKRRLERGMERKTWGDRDIIEDKMPTKIMRMIQRDALLWMVGESMTAEWLEESKMETGTKEETKVPPVSDNTVDEGKERLLQARDALLQPYEPPEPDTAFLNLKIEEAGFSRRVVNILAHENIMTVEKLTQCTEDQLLTMRNLGEGTLASIKRKLGEHGLNLRGY